MVRKKWRGENLGQSILGKRSGKCKGPEAEKRHDIFEEQDRSQQPNTELREGNSGQSQHRPLLETKVGETSVAYKKVNWGRAKVPSWVTRILLVSLRVQF